MKNGKYKVLINSGGGCYGVIIATFLSYINSSEQELADIDCIAGTSIGGILSLAYASGAKFADVQKMFVKDADKAFKKRWQAKLWPLACPTYDNTGLDKLIKALVGDKKVGDIHSVYPDLSIVVPALDVTNDKFKVYDNITGQDDDVSLFSIAGQTSAAPSYFYGRDVGGNCMVDGGVVDNVPVITTATALKSKLHIDFKDMDVLCIGTGDDKDEEDVATPKRYNNYSLLDICTKLIVPYVTFSNMLTTIFWGKNLGFNSFEYFNPVKTTGHMDNIKEIPGLIKQCEDHKYEFIETWNNWLNK